MTVVIATPKLHAPTSVCGLPVVVYRGVGGLGDRLEKLRTEVSVGGVLTREADEAAERSEGSMMQTGLGRVRLLPHTEGLARGRSVRPLVPLVALIPDAPVQARRPDGNGEVEVATVVIRPGTARRRRV